MRCPAVQRVARGRPAKQPPLPSGSAVPPAEDAVAFSTWPRGWVRFMLCPYLVVFFGIYRFGMPRTPTRTRSPSFPCTETCTASLCTCTFLGPGRIRRFAQIPADGEGFRNRNRNRNRYRYRYRWAPTPPSLLHITKATSTIPHNPTAPPNRPPFPNPHSFARLKKMKARGPFPRTSGL